MILGWFWNFIIITVSWSFNKSVLFDGYSKVFDVSTVSAKCVLKILAISSLFTSKVCFLITSLELLIISPFSIRIILESLACWKSKASLIPKRFWIFRCLCIIEKTKFWISIKRNYQISLFLIFSNSISKFSSICFVFKFRALRNGFTKIPINMGFMITS